MDHSATTFHLDERVFDNRLLIYLLGRSAVHGPAGGDRDGRIEGPDRMMGAVAGAEGDRQRDRYFDRLRSERLKRGKGSLFAPPVTGTFEPLEPFGREIRGRRKSSANNGPTAKGACFL